METPTLCVALLGFVSGLWGLVLWVSMGPPSPAGNTQKCPSVGHANSQASLHVGGFLTVSRARTSRVTGLCSCPPRPGTQVPHRPSLFPHRHWRAASWGRAWKQPLVCRTRPRTVSPAACPPASGRLSPATSPSLRAQVPPLSVTSTHIPLLSRHDDDDYSFHFLNPHWEAGRAFDRGTRFADEEREAQQCNLP